MVKYGGKLAGAFLFAFSIALLASGCTYVDERKEAAESHADLILEAIENKDPDGLVDLFSEYAVRSCELQTQAQELLSFIDGHIVSAESVNVVSHEKDLRIDDTGYEYFQMSIDVHTDTSREYIITYDYFVGDYPEHQRNGINRIRVADRAAYSVEEGYAESGIRKMGVK